MLIGLVQLRAPPLKRGVNPFKPTCLQLHGGMSADRKKKGKFGCEVGREHVHSIPIVNMPLKFITYYP